MTPTPAPGRRKDKKLLVVALGVGGLCACGALGLLARIVAPNFSKYRISSRQAEAKMTLRVLLTQEEQFRAKEGTWATSPRQLIEYANSGPQNYTCFLSPSGAWGGKKDRIAFDQLPLSVKARLEQNDAAHLTIACATNLDADPLLDVWTISSDDPNPKHELDDTTN